VHRLITHFPGDAMMLKPEGRKNVVLVCASGVTGAVAGLPVAMALKTHRPECRVTSVISADATPVLERHPAVDMITCDLRFRALKRLFRQQSYDLALFFTASRTSLLAAMASRIPIRTLYDARDGMQTIRELLAGLFRPGWGMTKRLLSRCCVS
jgi:ADP-heptose:LPS heptosyltransferase